MNRIASRAITLILPVLLLLGGLGLFAGEYWAKAEDWILFSGSPHVYADGRVGTGVITDREGILLADLTQGRTYSPNETVRRATLHWVGDRQGNIRASWLDTYRQQLLDYDPVRGLYAYGENSARVELTLSAKIQAAALEAMGECVGTVAVYNYQTGQIICAVSTPTFDPDNVPDIASDTTGAYEGVYLNRFLQTRYIPGSIFKIVTLTAALETVPDIESMRFSCAGKLELAGGKVTCMRPHGDQSLKDCFRNSCNCAFAQISGLVGPEKLEEYVELLRVTEPVSFDGLTGISGNFDLEGASPQQIAWSAIGQHRDQINPAAYLRFLGVIAGAGEGAEPYVVESVHSGKRETYRAEPESFRLPVSQETLGTLKEYMANNVSEKYGSEHFPGLTVCAKSGTGEVGGGSAPNAMFAGFLADPEHPWAFIVAVEKGGFGADTCVPILSRVLAACVAEIQETH